MAIMAGMNATAGAGVAVPRTPAEFWRWWTAELRGLVPRALRARWRVESLSPLIEVLDDSYVLKRPVVEAGRVAYRVVDEIAREPGTRPGADPQLAMAVEALQAETGRGPLTVSLPKAMALRRDVVLPLAVEENLREAVEFEVDRLTPFRADQVYCDAVVVDRDAAARECRVLLVYALRSHVDDVAAGMRAAGAELEAVVPQGAESAGVNLLPVQEERAVTSRTVLRLLPWVLVLLLALAATAIPIWQKRELAIAINREVGRAHDLAQTVDTIRREAEQLEGQYNFLLARKFAFPSTVQLLEELTRLFPDDTWLSQLDMRTTGRGKEVSRELQMRGDTANAGRLISVLEGSSLITGAAPRSPTLKLQPGPGEAFDLGAQVRSVPLPPAIPLAPRESGAPAVAGAEARQAPESGPDR
jgi:general secretion pathway protein L